MRDCGRTKQWIDSWPTSVLAGPLSHEHLVRLQQEVMIRRRDVDPPWLEPFAVFGKVHVKRLVTAEAVRERCPRIVRRHVLDNEHGCG